MANKKVSLVRLCKTENGWKRYPAAIGRNGKIRPDWVVIDVLNNTQKRYPEGHYELRSYKGKKTVYDPVGANAADALAALHRKTHYLVARESAVAAGVQVVGDVVNKRPTLNAKKSEFLKRLKAKGHQRASETSLQAIDDFLDATSLTYVDEVNEEAVLRFYRSLRKRGNGDRTIYNKHMSLFAFFKWLKLDTKALAEKAPTYTEREVEIYDKEDLKALLDACDDYQRMVFETLLKTGMRMQEGMHLEWVNVDFRNKRIKVRERLDSDLPNVSIKDRAERSIPLDDGLAEALKVWKETHKGTRLVLGTVNDTPNWKWLRMLKRLAKRAGLNCDHCAGCRGTGECSRWKLKTFRSTYTTTMLRAGVDPRTLMEWTGHEDLATILKYLAPIRAEEAKEKVNTVQWV